MQEFTEWCVLEQAKAAGCNFIPDRSKLENLPPADYLPKLIDQFMKVKPDPIKAGLVAAIAGKEADKHALSGLAVVVDFVSLYVKYLIPKEGMTPEDAEAVLTKASQHQCEKLTEIAKKHGVAL
nr:ANTAR domain-containing protein [Komarekiella delphini-convector]